MTFIYIISADFVFYLILYISVGQKPKYIMTR